MKQTNKLSETVAELLHNKWADWLHFFFSLGVFNEDGTWTLNRDQVSMWRATMNTPYCQLTAEGKLKSQTDASAVLSVMINKRSRGNSMKQQKEQKFGGDGRPDLIIIDDVDVKKESVYTWVKRVILNVKSFLWSEGGVVPGLPDVPLPLLPGERIVRKGSLCQRGRISKVVYDKNQAVQLAITLAERLGYNVGIDESGQWFILYIELPTGQVSWCIPNDQFIVSLPMYEKEYDQHTVEERRVRIEDFLK